MPANSTHPDYDSALPAWLRARDVFAGEDAVKAAGERYLPKLDSQSADEYNAYRARASFFNATARTVDGFVGLIFRREPTFKIPENSAGVGRALAAFVEANGLSLLAGITSRYRLRRRNPLGIQPPGNSIRSNIGFRANNLPA